MNTSYSVLSVFLQRNTIPEHMNYEFIEKHGDFLCGNTAGWELDGDYEYGKDFTVTYDPEAVLDDWNIFDDDSQREAAQKNITLSYGPLKKSTIDFSDGEWVWKDHDGKTLSHGTYSESEEHKGFIIVRPSSDTDFSNAGNEYIYFDGGDVFYPFAVDYDSI